MTHNFSREYKLICRFFKEAGLYKEFLEYQKCDIDSYHKIAIDTKEPVRELGESSITHFIEEKYSVRYLDKFYDVFKIWLNEFYRDSYPNLWLSNIKSHVDVNKRRVYLRKEKK